MTQQLPLGSPQAISATLRNVTGQVSYSLSSSTAATLATVFGGAIPSGTAAVQIQADGNTIRFTQDGVTTPTASVGTRIDDGVVFSVDSAPLSSVLLIAQTATTTIQVTAFDRV